VLFYTNLGGRSLDFVVAAVSTDWSVKGAESDWLPSAV
jgi:hypothetical protein